MQSRLVSHNLCGNLVVNSLLLWMLLDPYQSRFIMNTIVNINQDTIQSVFAGVLKIQLNQELKAHTKNIVEISIRIRLSLYSQVSVLHDTTQFNSQSISLSFKKVIQDTSRSWPINNYSHTVIKAEYYRNWRLFLFPCYRLS